MNNSNTLNYNPEAACGLTIDVIRKEMLACRNDLDITWVLTLLESAYVRRGVTAGQHWIFTGDCMAKQQVGVHAVGRLEGILHDAGG